MRKVVATTPDGRSVIFRSAKSASRLLGMRSSSPISNALCGNTNSVLGLIWSEYDDQKVYKEVELFDIQDALDKPRGCKTIAEWLERMAEGARLDAEEVRKAEEKSSLKRSRERAKAARAEAARKAREARAEQLALGAEFENIGAIREYERHIPSIFEGARIDKYGAEAEAEKRERARRERILAQPHTYGYYDKTMVVIKLPVSGAIVPKTHKAVARLRAELKGREWCWFEGRKIAVVK